LNLFKLSLCQFPTRFLGFLELFSNFPLNAFGRLSQGVSLPPEHHENNLNWVDPTLMAPLDLA
jgi:hypothetical protein